MQKEIELLQDKVWALSTEEIRKAIKDIYKINNSCSPSDEKMSSLLKELFITIDSPKLSWFDQYEILKEMIIGEIIHRITIDSI